MKPTHSKHITRLTWFIVDLLFTWNRLLPLYIYIYICKTVV
uniref:Uncharacterized protein n=1 Tax=Rhizophora mucronata TaxID=61149 RepID=A0A2P2P385_RHIMU